MELKILLDVLLHLCGLEDSIFFQCPLTFCLDNKSINNNSNSSSTFLKAFYILILRLGDLHSSVLLGITQYPQLKRFGTRVDTKGIG